MNSLLDNRQLIIRPLKPEDAPRISLLSNNINIWKNVRDSFPFPYKLEDAQTFIQNCINQNPMVTFGIEYDGEIVGAIGFELQSDVYRLSAELGYWIGEPYWGKGIATQSVKSMVKFGFNELNLIRIYAGVFESNKASMKVLEKAGFKKECIAKKAVIKNGEIMDGHRYAITSDYNYLS